MLWKHTWHLGSSWNGVEWTLFESTRKHTPHYVWKVLQSPLQWQEPVEMDIGHRILWGSKTNVHTCWNVAFTWKDRPGRFIKGDALRAKGLILYKHPSWWLHSLIVYFHILKCHPSPPIIIRSSNIFEQLGIVWSFWNACLSQYAVPKRVMALARIAWPKMVTGCYGGIPNNPNVCLEC